MDLIKDISQKVKVAVAEAASDPPEVAQQRPPPPTASSASSSQLAGTPAAPTPTEAKKPAATAKIQLEKASRDELIDFIKKQNQHIKTLETKSAEFLAVYKKQKDQLKALEAESQQRASDEVTARLRTELERAKREYSELENKNRIRSRDLEETIKERAVFAQSLQAQIESMSRDKETMVQSSRTQLSMLMTQLEEAQKALTENEAYTKALERKLKEGGGNGSELSQQIDSLEKEKRELQSQLQKQRSDLAAAEKLAVSLESQLQSVAEKQEQQNSQSSEELRREKETAAKLRMDLEQLRRQSESELKLREERFALELAAAQSLASKLRQESQQTEAKLREEVIQQEAKLRQELIVKAQHEAQQLEAKLRDEMRHTEAKIRQETESKVRQETESKLREEMKHIEAKVRNEFEVKLSEGMKSHDSKVRLAEEQCAAKLRAEFSATETKLRDELHTLEAKLRQESTIAAQLRNRLTENSTQVDHLSAAAQAAAIALKEKTELSQKLDEAIRQREESARSLASQRDASARQFEEVSQTLAAKGESLNKLEKEVVHLTTELTKKNSADQESFRAESARLQTELEAQRAETARLSAELTAAKNSTETLQGQVKELETYKAEIAAKHTQMNQLLAKAKQSIQQKNQNLEEGAKVREQLEKEKAELSAKFQELSISSTNRVSELSSELSAAVSARDAALRNFAAANEANSKNLEISAAGNLEETSSQPTDSNLDSRLLFEKVEKLKSLLVRSSAQIKDQKRVITEQSAELSQLRNKISQLEDSAAANRSKDSQMQNSAQISVQEIAKVQELANSYKFKATQFEAEAKELREELQKTVDEFKAYKVRAHSAIQQQQHKNTSTPSSSSSSSSISAETESDRSLELREEIQKQKKLIHQLQTLNAELQSKSSRSEEITSEFDRLSEKTKKLQTETESLRNELRHRDESLRHQMQTAEAEKRAIESKHSEGMTDLEMRNAEKLDELRVQLKQFRDRAAQQSAEKDAEIARLRQEIQSIQAAHQQSLLLNTIARSERLASESASSSSPPSSAQPNSNNTISSNSKQLELVRSLVLEPLTPTTTAEGSNPVETTLPTPSGSNTESEQLLHFAEMRSAKDNEIAAVKSQLVQIQTTLRETEQMVKLHEMQEAVLKKEIRDLERSRNREGANLEYLKNVVVKYMETQDHDLGYGGSSSSGSSGSSSTPKKT